MRYSVLTVSVQQHQQLPAGMCNTSIDCEKLLLLSRIFPYICQVNANWLNPLDFTIHTVGEGWLDLDWNHLQFWATTGFADRGIESTWEEQSLQLFHSGWFSEAHSLSTCLPSTPNAPQITSLTRLPVSEHLLRVTAGASAVNSIISFCTGQTVQICTVHVHTYKNTELHGWTPVKLYIYVCVCFYNYTAYKFVKMMSC